MANTDILFTGSIPQLYDQLMVPMLFDAYARDLAARTAKLAPASVLEMAAGTGAVTRILAAGLGPATTLIATDLNQAMLDRATSQIPPDPRLTFQQADAQALPFPDHSFDLVLCQVGVMFFPDKPRAYAEAYRVLKPGGTFLFNTWDGLENNDFVRIISARLAELYPDNPPAFMARIPHGYHDAALIRSQLAAAGFTAITCETVEGRSRATAQNAATAYCHGTPLRAEIEQRTSHSLSDVTQSCTQILTQTYGTGPIEARISAQVFSAKRATA